MSALDLTILTPAIVTWNVMNKSIKKQMYVVGIYVAEPHPAT